MLATTQALTATRATGMAAYGIALFSCTVAMFLARADREKARFAARLAVFEGLLLLDMAFNWRWELHQFFMEEATKAALYASRRGPQALVLAILVLLFFLGARFVSRGLHGRIGALLAVNGALISLVLWCAEIVSLHAVDHILYHTVGEWMTVSFLWVIACAATSVGILVDARSTSKRVHVHR